MGQIFMFIELILKLIGLWDDFSTYTVKKHAAEQEQRKQQREKSVDDSKKAESDDDIWNSQDGIVSNSPKP